jgi:hypothetical protein
MWVTAPVSSRVVRRLRGRAPLAEAATAVVEAAPATDVPPPPPPTHDPEELERITAPAPYSTLEGQMAWLAGTRRYGPAMAYELPPLWFVDGNFARGRVRFEMNAERERLLVRSRDLRTFEGVAFVSSTFANKFFGHQIGDELPAALLGPDFGEPWYVNAHAPTPHVAGYRRACDVDLPVTWSGFARRCWVFEDAFLNDSKVGRIRELRRRLGATVAPGVPAVRTYVRRGASGGLRAPRNEAEVEAVLAGEGWRIVDPASAALPELLGALAAAPVVVGVEGSNLAHAFYGLRTGAALVPVIPPDRFGLWLKDFADRLGFRFGFHVGRAVADGWEVDIDALRRLVDRAEVAPI